MLDLARQLTLEEHGALNVIIDLYCHKYGELRDEDRFIAAHMNVSDRAWRRLKDKLQQKGLIAVSDGKIRCLIAEPLLRDAILKMENNSRAGRASAEKRRQSGGGPPVPEAPKQPSGPSDSFNNSHLAHTGVQRALATRTETEEEITSTIRATGSRSAARAGGARSVGECIQGSGHLVVQTALQAMEEDQPPRSV